MGEIVDRSIHLLHAGDSGRLLTAGRFKGVSDVCKSASNFTWWDGKAHEPGARTSGLFQNRDGRPDPESDRDSEGFIQPFPANGYVAGRAREHGLASRLQVGFPDLGL